MPANFIGKIGAFGRDGNGDDLKRDVNFSEDAGLAVDLPEGTYVVAITMGDPGNTWDETGASWKAGTFARSVRVKASSSRVLIQSWRRMACWCCGCGILVGATGFGVINLLDIVAR